MKRGSCCGAPRSVLRALAGGAWIALGAALLLIPKCPVCLAGYIALFTGIGISTGVSSNLRAGLIVFCGVLLILLFIKSFRSFVRSVH